MFHFLFLFWKILRIFGKSEYQMKLKTNGQTSMHSSSFYFSCKQSAHIVLVQMWCKDWIIIYTNIKFGDRWTKVNAFHTHIHVHVSFLTSLHFTYLSASYCLSALHRSCYCCCCCYFELVSIFFSFENVNTICLA